MIILLHSQPHTLGPLEAYMGLRNSWNQVFEGISEAFGTKGEGKGPN